MYQKNSADGYIVSIVEGASSGNISDAEYNDLLEIIRDKPAPPDGCDYRLREDLTWELCELPAPGEDEDEVATEADYLAALAALGVE